MTGHSTARSGTQLTDYRARESDHNPDADGYVMAFDLTVDPANGVVGDDIAAAARLDPRSKYVIWNRRIWARDRDAEGWRRYNGANGHFHHVHVSVLKQYRDDEKSWWTPAALEPAPQPVPPSTEDDMPVMARERGKPTVFLTDLLTAKRSLDGPAEVAALKAAGIRDVGEVPADLLADVPTVAG